MTRRYDRNRNRRPDRDEVIRFLFRNRGIEVPFRLIGTNYYREINRSQSALFAAIDTDGNRIIDAAELNDAPQALFRFDPNADGRIDPGEVIQTRENDPAWNRRKSNRRGDVAMDLEGYVDWQMVSYSIESMRRRTPFDGGLNPVAQSDQDQNESLSAEEAKQLRACQPALRLKVEFAGKSADEPKISVQWVRPELENLAISQQSDSHVAVTDGAFTLLAQVTDRQMSRNRIPRQVFDMIDANNDGVLEENEIPDAVPDEYSFEQLDADEDGKLTFEEVNSAPQLEIPPIWAVQVRARGAEFPDALFAYLDTNQDRFLSSREMLTADERLRQCIQDRETIRPEDVPDTFAIQFLRADPMQDQENFAFAPTIEVATSDWPRWAQNMDVNRDGEISQVEFPGNKTQFDSLDSSGDGFIDSDEVTAYLN